MVGDWDLTGAKEVTGRAPWGHKICPQGSLKGRMPLTWDSEGSPHAGALEPNSTLTSDEQRPQGPAGDKVVLRHHP